jgi:hypothetical protein
MGLLVSVQICTLQARFCGRRLQVSKHFPAKIQYLMGSQCLICFPTTQTLGTYTTFSRILFAMTGATGGGRLPTPLLLPGEFALSLNVVIRPLRKLDLDVQSAGSGSCLSFLVAIPSSAILIPRGFNQGNVHIVVSVSHSMHLSARRLSIHARSLNENNLTKQSAGRLAVAADLHH